MIRCSTMWGWSFCIPVFTRRMAGVWPCREEPDIKLVYSVKQDKPAIFDAFSGEILDGSGKPFVERKVAEYNDIDGHYTENQVVALAEYGISLPGEAFRPLKKSCRGLTELLVKGHGILWGL